MLKAELEAALAEAQSVIFKKDRQIRNLMWACSLRTNKPNNVYIVHINAKPKVSYFGSGAWKRAQIHAKEAKEAGWPSAVTDSEGKPA